MTTFASLLRNRAVLLGAVVAFALSGTGAAVLYRASEASTTTRAADSSQPVSVSVSVINAQVVRLWSEFSGRMNAVDYAEIRPEVGGRITEIRFRDGQTVKAGDVLFVIDPRPYEAAVAKAVADLASARTNSALANVELNRAVSLVKRGVLAQATYDQRANTRDVAEANVKAAEAALSQAQIDVDHAYVKAPISGRVSRPEITVGNLVQTTSAAPLLASIVSSDGIYADFDVDEQTYVKSVHAHAGTHDQEQEIPVELTVPGDGDHVYRGTIYSFDNRIDTGSGTIRGRARFDNADGSLVPGMFVRVRIGSSVDSKVLLVPERAISSDQSKKFLYVVDSGNRAVFREVSLGQTVEGSRIVLSGLRAGERVIVDGLQHVEPDKAVQVSEVVAYNSRPAPANPKAN